MTAQDDAKEAFQLGTWFHVYTIDEMQEFYNFRLPAIREAARECGYAIGVHGSERRDFDLLAMPWVDNPSSIDELAKAVQMAACGFELKNPVWTEKPSGRKSISLHACWCEWYDMISAGHIDLSVVPTLQSAAQATPSTHVLAPRAPTGRMLCAFYAPIREFTELNCPTLIIEEGYRAMLAAIPQAEGGTDRGTGAWYVKDFADGWIKFYDPKMALNEAQASGAVMRFSHTDLNKTRNHGAR